MSCIRIGLLGVACASIGWAVSAHPLDDDRNAEAAWIKSFVQLVSGREVFEARAAEVARVFRPLIPLSADLTPGCHSGWSLAAGAPRFVSAASLNLVAKPGVTCELVKLGVLMVILKTSRKTQDEAEFSALLTTRFGQPTPIRTGTNLDLHWQIDRHAAVEVNTSSDDSEANELMLSVAQAP